jgi:glycerate dehydrogenase
MKGVILDADSLGQDIDLSPITDLLDDWQVFPAIAPADVSGAISDASVILSNKIRLDESNLGESASPRFISVMATGTNNVDLACARRRGIDVSNAVAYATPSVVQHTLSLILALSNNLPAYLADVRAGRWQDSNVFCRLDYPIQEAAGKTLAIIGYGELGSSVAKAAEALGLMVIISERPGARARAGRVSFEAALAQADYVSLHCPLTEENRHLINAATLRQMKPGAFLINTARGGLINSVDLVKALKTGGIAGAAIDVLDREPAEAGDPLLTPLPNLLLTPHNAWGAIESRRRLVIQMKENILGFLAGNPPRLVN